jgi:hypothetical protein
VEAWLFQIQAQVTFEPPCPKHATPPHLKSRYSGVLRNASRSARRKQLAEFAAYAEKAL